jgi:tetratricopeptide (TPR) repeat protein
MSADKSASPDRTHVVSYWRPLNEPSDRFEHYAAYIQDPSGASHATTTLASFAQQTPYDRIQTITRLGQAMGRGPDVLSNPMPDVTESLLFLARNMDLKTEQVKLGSISLQNMTDGFGIAMTDKARQQRVRFGARLFVNAAKEPELYRDALLELQEAERLQKNDHFVLHRIGCLYLYVPELLDPVKAMDYFTRAARHARAEPSFRTLKWAHIMTNVSVNERTEKHAVERIRGMITAGSCEKAAFAAYVMGRFDDAVRFQSEACTLEPSPNNRFILAKFLVRNRRVEEALSHLEFCIRETPMLAVAVFKELDLASESAVLQLLNERNTDIDRRIEELTVKWSSTTANRTGLLLEDLKRLARKSYEVKVADFSKFVNIHTEPVVTRKQSPITEKPTHGSRHAGGIVFHLDAGGSHGLVCTEKDLGVAFWGGKWRIDAKGKGIANGDGMANSRKILELASWFKLEEGIHSAKKLDVVTAARLCLESDHNGYTDWYLPTIDELRLIYLNLKVKKLATFEALNYWSSNEDFESTALYYYFGNGSARSINKTTMFGVRGVRRF